MRVSVTLATQLFRRRELLQIAVLGVTQRTNVRLKTDATY